MKRKTLLIASFVCVLVTSSSAGLVAHYKFDEGTATTNGDGEGAAAIPLVSGRPRQFYRIEEIANP